MGAKDRTEGVLRDIHVLFSKARPYNDSKREVIVDKNEMMELLKELNKCMYDMQDEYDLSVVQKDKVNREMQRMGDDIIFEASRKAEDIYAASIMYTDNALNNIMEIMRDANRSVDRIYRDVSEQMKTEMRVVKGNQSDLKAGLNDLIDTQKYLRLIDEENRRLKKEKEAQQHSGNAVSSSDSGFARVKPEIKINKDYFIQNGIPLDAELTKDSDVAVKNSDTAGEMTEAGQLTEEQIAAMQSELDNEYFEWKDEELQEKDNAEKGSKRVFPFFGKNRE